MPIYTLSNDDDGRLGIHTHSKATRVLVNTANIEASNLDYASQHTVNSANFTTIRVDDMK